MVTERVYAPTVRFNKYLPFALLYFFLNAAGLPFGLTYMTILSPLLYYWVVQQRGKEIFWPFLLVLAPFAAAQLLFNDVKLQAYLVSFLNLAAVYIFCQAFYTFLSQCRNKENIFRILMVTNFALCLIAIPFYFSEYFSIFWIEQELTKGVNDFRRLKMFTYEASYYATLFVPLFLFFFLRLVLGSNRLNAWLLIPALILPLLLSFSLGVMAALALSLVLLLLIHFRRLLIKRRVRHLLVLSLLALFGTALVLIFFFPDNTLLFRLENVLAGKDSSGRGRTYEAFDLAFLMLDGRADLWGIGLGQIKVIGIEIIRDFYLYPMDHTIFAIPNATAETLAIFGTAGLALRLIVQVFLFFYTRVWTSYYRLAMFLFIFIYQFTGSFLTNHAEYVIWILAFTEVFPEFRVNAKNRAA